MGGGDYCAVYGCSNDRRKPEIAIVMNHVGKLRWYGPKNRHIEMAEVTGGCQCLQRFARINLLQVKDLISALLQPFYLKEYTHLQEIKKRKSPRKRNLLAVSSPPPPKTARNIKRDGSDNVNSVFIVEQHRDHIYKVEEKTLASWCTPVTAYYHCIRLNSKVKIVKSEKKLKSELEGSKTNEGTNQFCTFIQPIFHPDLDG